MKLPSFRRIFQNDYPAQFKQLIEILSVSLNNGIEVLYQALNNGLTLEDNVLGTSATATITTDANGTPTKGSTFVLSSANKVNGIIVLSATNQTNPGTFPSGGVFISGTQSGTTFNITNITGLQAGQTYSVKLFAFQSD